jgi:MinD superfamily P-loop ATPase
VKKLLILSGKGGTGKTTTAAAFIRFSKAEAFADCDVDAPNLHLVTAMRTDPETSDYYGSQKAAIDQKLCIGCGACMEACRFEAVEKRGLKYSINEYACEGCGVCVSICPRNAAVLHDDIAGNLTLYRDEQVFSTAELKMGRGNSGKLVSAVKAAMLQTAPKAELAIIDGSPGIGCPVIASISGVNLVLIVTEPTLSGLSDLRRILKTTGMFQTKTAVCINRFDVCLEQSCTIESYCLEHNVPFVGRIPYDRQASLAINSGRSLADTDCPARDALKKVFDRTMELLKE